jgi:hydrogenase small subunit
VEDAANAINQDVAIGMLENMGCRFVTAPNGRHAVRLAAQERFDLILMDGEMPEMDGFGLQFLKRDQGGFLGKAFRSRSGLPVLNVRGCPAHPDWISQILVAIATSRGGELALDELQRPKTFFTSFTQTGCTRNMHFSYKVSATEFGQCKDCLFYDLGCRGPMTHSPCNRILWNRQSSKTRAGMPCLGCTEPEFPFFDLAPGTVFRTQTVMGVPRTMPTGIDKIGYIKLTAAAKAVSPRWAEDDLFI